MGEKTTTAPRKVSWRHGDDGRRERSPQPDGRGEEDGVAKEHVDAALAVDPNGRVLHFNTGDTNEGTTQNERTSAAQVQQSVTSTTRAARAYKFLSRQHG